MTCIILGFATVSASRISPVQGREGGYGSADHATPGLRMPGLSGTSPAGVANTTETRGNCVSTKSSRNQRLRSQQTGQARRSALPPLGLQFPGQLHKSPIGPARLLLCKSTDHRHRQSKESTSAYTTEGFPQLLRSLYG